MSVKLVLDMNVRAVWERAANKGGDDEEEAEEDDE